MNTNQQNKLVIFQSKEIRRNWHEEEPETFDENRKVAKRFGNVAGNLFNFKFLTIKQRRCF